MSSRPWILLFAIVLTSFLSMRRTLNSIQLIDSNNKRSLSLHNNNGRGAHMQWNEINLTNTTETSNEPLVLSSDKKNRKSCKHMEQWQSHSSAHPSCNTFHEVDMTATTVELLASGSYRHVWKVYESNGFIPRVVKTLRFPQYEFDAKTTRRHAIDAMALEQLSSSPYIVDIYGYCSNSALVDYTDDGDLTRLHTTTSTNHHSSKRELLQVAFDVAASIADIHAHSIVHSDIKPNQFLNFGSNKYLLNDFNRAHFVKWNEVTNDTCPFTETKNWGAWRSPEEYLYQPQTQAIDVYSLGHVLHFILTGRVPFGNLTTKEAVAFVKKGGREHVHDDGILLSGHPFDKALVDEILDMCFEFEPAKRASARQVMNRLRRALDEIEE